jgi:hypothetical protein
VDSHVSSGFILHSNGEIFKKMYTSHSPACISASIGGIFVKIHSPFTLRTHNKWYGLDVIGKKLFAFYLMSNMPSWLYIGFQW